MPTTTPIEEDGTFRPRFGPDGLMPVFVVDATTRQGLMSAWMNALALEETLKTGLAHYWSRSRNRLWQKGETSGERQKVVEIRVDCDQDTLLLHVQVEGRGATCHTGRRSCFYRRLLPGAAGIVLERVDDERLFDPATVYGVK